MHTILFLFDDIQCKIEIQKRKYLGGLGGYGKGIENALNSAKVFNQIHPTYMIMMNISVLPDTELY